MCIRIGLGEGSCQELSWLKLFGMGWYIGRTFFHIFTDMTKIVIHNQPYIIL